MTIMSDSSAFLAYPYERLEAKTVQALKDCCKLLFEHLAINRVCLSLECYLQVTKQRLTFGALASAKSDPLLTMFIGSLISPSFRNLSLSCGHGLAQVLKNTVNRLRDSHHAPHFHLYKNKRIRSTDIQRARLCFETLELCPEKAWYWSGWSCRNSKGNLINLPLLPFYQKFGKAFTSSLHAVCVTYAHTRRAPVVRAVNYLSRFVNSVGCRFSLAELTNRQRSADFFNEFWRHFYRDCIHGGSKHSYAVGSWRTHILPFIKEQLLTSGLFAQPHRLPEPAPAWGKGEDANVKGAEHQRFKDKLLVHVPLYLSDEQAFQVIRARLFEADKVANAWCDSQINSTILAHTHTKEMAKTGISLKDLPRAGSTNTWHASRNNPSFLNNLAATLHNDGFQALVQSKKTLGFATRTLGKVLALPTSDTLFPFCLKLIKLHPEITPSFLSSVELFDLRGQMRGKKTGDVCNYLHGFKDRKHAESSEMYVELNAESEKIVNFLVALTAPLRECLKAQHDDRWRMLLLTCKAGFGRPYPYQCKMSFTPGKLLTISNELVALHPESKNLIPELAHSLLRPSTMRSTAAALVFLETSSVYKMAQALGHQTYDADLLLRYLPSSILHFYRDRWVRAFQTGIIIQAMADSPLLLQASGFSHVQELDAFLEHHVLNIPTSTSVAQSKITMERTKGQTLICLSPMILRILLTLNALASTDSSVLNEKARHWATFTTHLLAYLEADPDNHLEMLEMVHTVRALAPINFPRGVVHEQ
ncbi:hypothetical protein [Pseudomonas zeae]|uniref:hypothetical protein n=1 Tax=Pseudomonas zeae TaxID=2745510 RepID=UPI0039E121A3